MNEATTIRVGGTAARPAAGEERGFRLRWRHLLIVPGLAIAIFANELGKTNGVAILPLIAFGIAPDVPRLFRIGRSGRASRVALAVFNLLHHPALPIAAVAIAATGIIPALWLVGSLVWLSHLVIGWGVGDVRRHAAPERSDA